MYTVRITKDTFWYLLVFSPFSSLLFPLVFHIYFVRSSYILTSKGFQVFMFHMLYSIVGDGQDILMESMSLLTTLMASIKGKIIRLRFIYVCTMHINIFMS